MSNSNHIPISATELGTLWMSYQEKTMMIRILEYILEKVEDLEAKEILQSHYNYKIEDIQMIKDIFQNEKATIPVGFTD